MITHKESSCDMNLTEMNASLMKSLQESWSTQWTFTDITWEVISITILQRNYRLSSLFPLKVEEDVKYFNSEDKTYGLLITRPMSLP